MVHKFHAGRFFGEKARSLRFLKKENLAVIVLLGVLLLVISIPSGSKKEPATQAGDGLGRTGLGGGGIGETVFRETGLSGTGTGGTMESGGLREEWEEAVFDERSYVMQMEKDLRDILSSVEGAGEVRVLISLRQSRELVVEQNRESFSLMQGGHGSGASVVKEIYPKIEGVIVAAAGVGTGNVRAELTEAVMALYGLEAHKVKVLKLGHISSHDGIE